MRESGPNLENSKEVDLKSVKAKVDRFAKEIIDTWNEDKGWSLSLTEEHETGFVQEYNKKVLELSDDDHKNQEIKKDLVELDRRQIEAREKFETIKKAIEILLTEYYFAVRGTDAEKDFEVIFPYAKVFKPSYHELSTGKTSPEDKKRELADEKVYIKDFRKMFEEYGADIIKRESK